jgi:hypothetical protein
VVRFLSAQPANAYYSWQVEVMLNSFLEQGVNLNHVDVVCSVDSLHKIPEDWTRLAEGYAARFFFYEDKRETRNYISSIRPNILKQHFKAHPYLESETLFYHDCDIALTKKINLAQFEVDDVWYGSDCRWYIGHDYILSKGEDVLNLMCETCSIDREVVKENELNSIGAQYIMKDVDWTFWEAVERNSERMFADVTSLNAVKKKENPKYHEVQIWCADMWAALWEAWRRGKKTVCHDDLKFSWGTSPIEEWDMYAIFHNAGVVEKHKAGFFFKSDYINKLPYFTEQKLNENFSSVKYWELIERTARKSVLV